MAQLNRKELKKQINSRDFQNVYLIYGEEKMYVRSDTDYLVAKLMGKEPPEFNYHNFSKDYNMDEIAVAVQVAPFLSEYNCVKVADFDANNCGKKELEGFIEIIKNVPDTTVLIISMPTLEQNPKKLGDFSKLVTLVKKMGVVCEINKESDISLARQIVKWADSRNIKIEQADAYKLQEYVGFDLNSIKNELDKLCNYVGDGNIITTEHIELLVSKRLEANIYNLTDAIVEGNGTKAFEILDTLFYQKEEPNDIINVISMSYIDFYRVRIAQECGVSLSEISQEFGYGKREFVLKKAGTKIRKISTKALRDSVNEITVAYGEMRSASVNQKILVEKLVAKLLMYATRGE